MTTHGARFAACVSTVVAVAAVAAASGGAAPHRIEGCAESRSACVAAPVPSLEPEATARLWRRLIAHPRLRAAVECRPLRAVFYATRDWLRLATKLAANASPCAQYYVSIPPLVSDKTKLRPDQAWRIRALGSGFHAIAEIAFTAWSKWVAGTGSSWYGAGVEARHRMVDAGFDVTKGDTWAVNEFPSSVRTGVGSARANVREFVRGLYGGDGTPPMRGAVLIVGVGQSTSNVSVYQTNSQNWLADSAFWTDMAAYVSDWSQEVYGDFRKYAVPGAPITMRRDYLNDYLQHELVLARAGPPAIEPARAYLESAYSPLANAAWQWDFGYGWTMVPVDQMQAFVSAQTYALRYFSATTGEAQDHWGFAWAPRNATGLSASDFAAQTGAILDRLGAAIRDSGQIDASDPGSGACGPPAQNVFCGGDLAGAQFTELWKSFRTWTQPALVFTTPPQKISAGTPSAAISLALVTSSGAPQIAVSPLAVTLSSSSLQGQFSASPIGPWSSTLTVMIPAGSNAAGPFYYLDTRAGSPELTAAAFGLTSGTQTETVLPGPPVSLRVMPSSAILAPRKSHAFQALTVDTFGNPVTVPATWSVTPARLGTVKKTGAATTFTAADRGGSGTLTATAAGATGPISGSATLTVTPGLIRVASIRYLMRKRTVLVTVTVVEARRRPISGALVFVLVRRNGHRYFSGHTTSGPSGRAIYRLRSRAGCYRTTVTRVTDPGYRWNRTTPVNQFCR